MPALLGHPRKEESFEVRKKYPRPVRSAVAAGQGWPKAQGRRLRLHPLKKGTGTNIADRKADPNSKQLNH